MMVFRHFIVPLKRKFMSIIAVGFDLAKSVF